MMAWAKIECWAWGTFQWCSAIVTKHSDLQCWHIGAVYLYEKGISFWHVLGDIWAFTSEPWWCAEPSRLSWQECWEHLICFKKWAKVIKEDLSILEALTIYTGKEFSSDWPVWQDISFYRCAIVLCCTLRLLSQMIVEFGQWDFCFNKWAKIEVLF